MKDKNSFDIPSYKFGIVKIYGYDNLLEKKGDDAFSMMDLMNSAVSSNQLSIIPFKDVDGLTIKEVQNTLGLKGPLLMVCYTKYNFDFRGIMGARKQTNILATFMLPKKDVDVNQNIPINQSMEKSLETAYPNCPDNFQRMIRCFFERFQDQTHQDTVERINKINIRK